MLFKRLCIGKKAMRAIALFAYILAISLPEAQRLVDDFVRDCGI